MNQLSKIIYREKNGFSIRVSKQTVMIVIVCIKLLEPVNTHTIERIDILPAFRRQGLARELLNHAIKYIKSASAQRCIKNHCWARWK